LNKQYDEDVARAGRGVVAPDSVVASFYAVKAD
jgi:hypothetical protein